MEEKTVIVLDEGVTPAEVAAAMLCCKTGPTRLQTNQDEE